MSYFSDVVMRWMPIVIGMSITICLAHNESINTMSNSDITKYQEHDVSYENPQAGVTLCGTLTLPQGDGPFPAVILVPGYGPQNRNAEMMGHKRFLVLADYLTKQGLAVLRFDKRGVGQSTGDFKSATSRDFADDVLAGINYLKSRSDIDDLRLGLIGHSEGGLISSMVAAESVDIAFVVLLAAAVQTDPIDLIIQTAEQLRRDKASGDLIASDSLFRIQVLNLVSSESDQELAEKQLHEMFDKYDALLDEALRKEAATIPFALSKQKAEQLVSVFNGPWYRYFLQCDPTRFLSNITVPVLALNGTNDGIISPHLSLPIINRALMTAGNDDYSVMELQGLNHVFQTCKTGSMAEYATIEETISPVALSVIAGWITERFC